MSYEDYFVLDIVTTHAVGIALINTVNVVNTAADRELFDYSETHCGKGAYALAGFGGRFVIGKIQKSIDINQR